MRTGKAGAPLTGQVALAAVKTGDYGTCWTMEGPFS